MSDSPVAAPPHVEQRLAERLFRFQPERALEGGGGEAQSAIGCHDQDDVGRVGDERGVAGFDHLSRASLAQLRVVAQDGTLAQHHQQREDEHDHRHHRHRAADLGPGEVDEHEKRDDHRRVGQAVHQRVRRNRGRPCRLGSGPQLLTSRRGERQVAADVEHVLQAAR